MLSIPIVKSWWRRNETDVLIVTAFILMAFSTYTIGRVSAVSHSAEQMVIQVPDSVARVQQELESALPLANLAAGMGKGVSGIPAYERRGEYVASKNGSYSYPADMSAALRIKAENRVWFLS